MLPALEVLEGGHTCDILGRRHSALGRALWSVALCPLVELSRAERVLALFG